MGSNPEMRARVNRFRPAIPPRVIDDLRARLRATRWPLGITEDGGIPATTMRELATHWLERFDWRVFGEALASVRHTRVMLDHGSVHAVHVASPDRDAPALLLLHGWPGSFLEFLPLLPRLADFHLVVPSLPGFGFSDVPMGSGMSNGHMAGVCADVMTALGYTRFLVHGGDVGAGVGTWLARRWPERVSGLHLNFIPGSYTPPLDDPLSPEEDAFLKARAAWIDANGAYGHVQRTRPLTLAYALADSPIGLAAWIVEKFREWADPRSSLPLDTLLANVTLYWATNTIASSMRVYLESARTPLSFAPGERIEVPCGIARFPHEIYFPPRSWVARVYDVVRWTDMPRGGHFAALEAPEALAADIVAFARGSTR